jgi:hypothetical protein
MIPNQKDLQWALEKVRADLQQWAGAESARLMFHQGTTPVIVVVGALAARPRSMPKAIRVFADAMPYNVAILWKGAKDPRASMPILPSTPAQDMQLDRDMWAGATPVVDRPVRLFDPAEHQPDTSIAQAFPSAQEEEYQLSLSARLPQFATPNFWSKTFRKHGTACLSRYAERTVVFSYKVPPDYMCIMTGLSYEFSDLVPFNQFIMHVLRDGNELGRWYDMRALDTPDPAEEYVFAGHYRPFPFYGRFDHDQTLTIAATVLGPYPFAQTSADAFGGCVQVYPTGWLGSLYDNRDGGARPVDMGELNDIYLGEPSVPDTAPGPIGRELRYARPGQWQPPNEAQ